MKVPINLKGFLSFYQLVISAPYNPQKGDISSPSGRSGGVKIISLGIGFP